MTASATLGHPLVRDGRSKGYQRRSLQSWKVIGCNTENYYPQSSSLPAATNEGLQGYTVRKSNCFAAIALTVDGT